MSPLADNRKLARVALAAGLAAALVALGGGAVLAAPTPGPATPPSGPDVGATGGAMAPPPETGPAAPPLPAPATASPEAPPPPAALTAEPASKTDSPGTASSADALDAEAAAQAAAMQEGGNSSGSQAGGESSRLSLYGFSDFTYTKPLSALTFSPDATFAVGNLNLYMGAEIAKDWRSLIEIRFMYLPDGSKQLGTAGAGMDASASDYTNEFRVIKWGGINIQRAQLERTFHKLLTIRVGQFLTPYGIWNVDHGSPVFIGVAKPYVVGQQFLPDSQTGIEIFGTWDIRSTQLGYHLTLSNGRGPIDTYQDLDGNKALGGRVFAKNESALGTFSLGGSFYYGRYTNKTTGATLDPVALKLKNIESISTQYDELSLAADLKWQLAGLLVQGELIMNEAAFTSAGRPLYFTFTGGPAGFTSNFRRWGTYGLVGYRLPFWGIMPFAEVDYYEEGPLSLPKSAIDLEFGVNVRITPSIVFKGQYTHAESHFFTRENSPQLLEILRFQLGWSF
jgi:hypothetical protein